MSAGPYTHYLVIDFEASGAVRDAREWEIVEFPCVVVDAAARAVDDGAPFSRFVRPTTHPRLSPACAASCGIEQSWVDAAEPIGDVLRDFVDWVAAHPSLQGGRLACLTCGDYDLGTALRYEAARKGIDVPLWLRRWVNVKRPFAAGVLGDPAGDPRRARGMAGMLRALGLPLVGRHHRGIDDARNIAAIACELLRRGIALPVTGAYTPAEPDTTPAAAGARGAGQQLHVDGAAAVLAGVAAHAGAGGAAAGAAARGGRGGGAGDGRRRPPARRGRVQ